MTWLRVSAGISCVDRPLTHPTWLCLPPRTGASSALSPSSRGAAVRCSSDSFCDFRFCDSFFTIAASARPQPLSGKFTGPQHQRKCFHRCTAVLRGLSGRPPRNHC